MEQFEIVPWLANVVYSLLEHFFGHSVSLRDAMAFTYVIVLCVGLTAVFTLTRKKYQVVPGPIQLAVEGYYNFIRNLCLEVIGEHKGERYVSVIGTIGLFIWLSNLMGLIPGFIAPTSNLNVTAGAALFVFIYYHYQGIKDHGIGYFKHFTGPVWWLAPLFIPLEIISHFSRPLSLALRLFGNIFGEDLVILVLFITIFPIIAPLPVMVLAIITSTIQALVFVMLSVTYIAGAVAEHH